MNITKAFNQPIFKNTFVLFNGRPEEKLLEAQKTAERRRRYKVSAISNIISDVWQRSKNPKYHFFYPIPKEAVSVA